MVGMVTFAGDVGFLLQSSVLLVGRCLCSLGKMVFFPGKLYLSLQMVEFLIEFLIEFFIFKSL